MRHRCILVALTLTTTLGVTVGASAREPAAPGVEVVDFLDADQVTGELRGPWEELLRQRRLGARHTLIQPRAHFRAEVLKSVENL